MTAKKLLVGAFTCFFLFYGCQSAQKKEAEQQIVPAEKERQLSKTLDERLDAAFKGWQAPEIERILNGLISKIIASNPELQASEAKAATVHLFSSEKPVVAPGLAATIYVSKGMLMSVSYENELAFLLGMQLSLLKEKATMQNLASLYSQDIGESMITLPTAPPMQQRDYLEKGWFEPGGLFDFGPESYLKAQRKGLEYSYAAKFDPRGAVTLLRRWYTAPDDARLRSFTKILPDQEEQLGIVRDEVAKLSPLRDPIVKGRAFDELQSRLQVKKAKKKP